MEGVGGILMASFKRVGLGCMQLDEVFDIFLGGLSLICFCIKLQVQHINVSPIRFPAVQRMRRCGHEQILLRLQKFNSLGPIFMDSKCIKGIKRAVLIGDSVLSLKVGLC